MATRRRVFFSFHFERDAWRAGQVRNCDVVRKKYERKGRFLDKADWEDLKEEGDAAVKKWINDQLNGTSVTIVLIGAETSKRKWVKHEIEESVSKGNGLLGIRVHNLKNQDGRRDSQGDIPLGDKYEYTVYNWIYDNGRENIGDWIEEAAKEAGR